MSNFRIKSAIYISQDDIVNTAKDPIYNAGFLQGTNLSSGLSSATNGDVLTWNSITSEWEFNSPPT